MSKMFRSNRARHLPVGNEVSGGGLQERILDPVGFVKPGFGLDLFGIDGTFQD